MNFVSRVGKQHIIAHRVGYIWRGVLNTFQAGNDRQLCDLNQLFSRCMYTMSFGMGLCKNKMRSQKSKQAFFLVRKERCFVVIVVVSK